MITSLQEPKLCPLANLQPCLEERCRWYNRVGEMCAVISLGYELIDELHRTRQVFRDALRKFNKPV